MAKYIAFTVKGLETIACGEIKGKIVEQGTKKIIFETDDELRVRQLRTVDDVGYFLGSRKVKSADEIVDLVKLINLAKAKPTDKFSLTLSFSRAGSIDKAELTQRLVKTTSSYYGWQYLERDHSWFDLRLFLDKDDLFLSVRVTEKPLFHRQWRQASIKGALRPTIAAAMVRWASSGRSGLRLVDNFCGCGTILAEARAMGQEVHGGDIDREAVAAARVNLPGKDVREQDGLKTSWPENYFDLAVSNLPWNKQIKTESVTRLYREALAEYQRIVKPSGQICLLVGKPELLIKLAGVKAKTVRLGYLGQNPTIVLIPAGNRRGHGGANRQCG